MSEWSELNERILTEMQIINATYNDEFYVHRVIRFLRDHPERAPDYIDFVPDWETRNIDDVQRI